MKQDLTQLCDDSIGCDEMNNYFATEADTMIDVVCEVDFEYTLVFNILHLTGTIIKLSHLNVKLSFSICISIYL